MNAQDLRSPRVAAVRLESDVPPAPAPVSAEPAGRELKYVRAEPEPAAPVLEHKPRRWPKALAKTAILAVILAGAGYAGLIYFRKPVEIAAPAPQARTSNGVYYPTASQWATLIVAPVQEQVFRAEHVTEGKIAVNEDSSTAVYSPYAGRVIKLLARPGDQVAAGQPLFTVEAADSVQFHNDYMTANATLNKTRSQLNLARTVETRLKGLYETRAIALREVQQAQADVVNAENDVRSAETALEAARNRLRILGRTDDEIAAFQKTGVLTAETPVRAPLAGTVVARKVGPGQYLNNGATDPVFVIGDLSKVWLIANVRETEAPNIHVGQTMYFKVLAVPTRSFPANISYISTALDPATRRLTVRAVVNNGAGLFKPEMFASVSILTGEGDSSPAVPRDAIIYEGDSARVWIVRDDRGIELRQIKPGLINGNFVQVENGLGVGQNVVTKGSLFIDREALGS